MISVENFYSVLYYNLLMPAGLDCCYYYPFGTTENLSRTGEYAVLKPKHDNHVLFHFDQEPLYNTSLGTIYDNIQDVYSNKICKLLANSEYSMIKKQICRERNMNDWYFFYHGFASLDWFRDTRYLGDLAQINKVYCSLNHIVISDKRDYRMAMIARLLQNNLTRHGDISFHATKQKCEQQLQSPWSNLSHHSKQLVETYLLNRNKLPLPLILDQQEINGDLSARSGHQEYKLWQNSFVHLVNETVFYDPKLHLTEKVFKPIVALRPFMLVSAPGNLAYLQNYGFKTFHTWFDESYDSITDHDQRLDAITHEIVRLCSLSIPEIKSMFDDMQEVLIYNKNHFFTSFRDYIVDELVDNFDACICVWNNGRIDPARTIPRAYDIPKVKTLLKQ